MATWITDLKNGSTLHGAVSSLAYQARTGSANGTGIDLRNGDNQSFLIIWAGAYTDGTHTITVEESNNDATAATYDQMAADAYAAVSPASSTSLTSGTASKVTVVNFWRSKRFARAVTTVAAATTGAIYGILIGSQKRMI